MKTVILPAAREDLIEIGDYIATDNRERAASFVDEIVAVIASIAERPKRFPSRDDLRQGLRVARHRNYLIFFAEVNDEIQVGRVLHGARNLKRLFET